MRLLGPLSWIADDIAAAAIFVIRKLTGPPAQAQAAVTIWTDGAND